MMNAPNSVCWVDKLHIDFDFPSAIVSEIIISFHNFDLARLLTFFYTILRSKTNLVVYSWFSTFLSVFRNRVDSPAENL